MKRKHFYLPLLFLASIFLFQNCTSDATQKSTEHSTTNTEHSATDSDVTSTASNDELTTKGMTPAQATLASLKIERPFPQLDVPFHKFPKIRNKAKTINLPTGTSIEIPANAFVDKDGNPVNGEVEIQYREMFNAAEIITSGLPMHVVDESGNVEWMQTAGMFEIKGFFQGEEVFIAPGKELTINMATEVKEEYQFWELDAEANNWIEKGISNPVASPMVTLENEETRSLNTQRKAIEKTKPAPPVAFDKGKSSFDADIDFQKFPELKNMEGIIWQYAGTDPEQDPKKLKWVQEEEWLEINLDEANKANEYILSFVSDKNRYSIPVCPSQKGKDYDDAMAVYNTRMASYKKELAAVTDKRRYANQQAKLMRTFTVQEFGVYNCDRIYKMQKPIQVFADFDFGGLSDKLKSMVTVYLVSGDNRTVIYYPNGQWKNIRFDARDKNCFIAVLPNNKIATFSNKQFKNNLNAIRSVEKGKPYTFEMNVESRPIETVADLQKQLINS